MPLINSVAWTARGDWNTLISLNFRVGIFIYCVYIYIYCIYVCIYTDIIKEHIICSICMWVVLHHEWYISQQNCKKRKPKFQKQEVYRNLAPKRSKRNGFLVGKRWKVIEGIAGAGTGFGRSASVLRVLKVLRVPLAGERPWEIHQNQEEIHGNSIVFWWCFQLNPIFDTENRHFAGELVRFFVHWIWLLVWLVVQCPVREKR